MDWRNCPDEMFIYPPNVDGPQLVPHKPRPECDAIYFFDFDSINEMGLDLRQCQNAL